MPTPMRLTYSDLTAEQNAPYNLANYGQDYNSRLANEQYAQMVAGMGLRGQELGQRRNMFDWAKQNWINEQANAKLMGKRRNRGKVIGTVAGTVASFIPVIGSAISPLAAYAGEQAGSQGAAGGGSEEVQQNSQLLNRWLQNYRGRRFMAGYGTDSYDDTIGR